MLAVINGLSSVSIGVARTSNGPSRTIFCMISSVVDQGILSGETPEDIPVERNSGCQRENMIDVTTCDYSDLSDSEDSEWEDAENRAVRSMVEHYNFDLVDRMTPMEYVPIPGESRRKWPKED